MTIKKQFVFHIVTLNSKRYSTALCYTKDFDPLHFPVGTFALCIDEDKIYINNQVLFMSNDSYMSVVV